MSYTPPPRPSRDRYTVVYRDAQGRIQSQTIFTTGEAAARLAVIRAEDIPASNIITAGLGTYHRNERH